MAELIFNLPRGRHLPRPQTTIAVLSSSAGAGGAVLSACFDVVLARPSINLNYHYGAMGLSGSELRSLVLPLRAGERAAEQLLTDRLPISPMAAQRSAWSTASGPTTPPTSTTGPGRSRHSSPPSPQGPCRRSTPPVPAGES